MVGTHTIIGGVGVNVFFSQIVGSNGEGKRIFGKVEIFSLEKPIMIGFPIIYDQLNKAKNVKKILKIRTDLFVIETIDLLYYEIGFLKN